METKPTTTKSRNQLKYRGSECLNCGHPLDLSDKYCPNCSQANSTKKTTLKDFFDEFFSTLISYDSKLLRSLSALLLRPGKITTEYLAGKRVSYTNPFRFMLSLGIVYFLAMNFTGNFSEMDRWGENNIQGAVTMDGPTNLSLKVNGQQQKEALNTLGSLTKSHATTALAHKRDSLILKNPKSYFNTLKDRSFANRYLAKQAFFRTILKKTERYHFDEIAHAYGIQNNLENRSAFNLASGIIRISRQPGSFISSIISKLPFLFFFLLPIFALFIWLIYIRKKKNYIEHLIFSFHNQSLLFILLIISFLIDSVFGTDSSWIFLLIFSIYLYKAMRKFYGQGRFKTMAKYILLNGIFFILATIAIIFLLMGSAFTY